MERIVVRNEEKLRPPDIDPLLLRFALHNRDPKQLEWHEPLLVPILQSLRINGHHQAQAAPKIYDRLVNSKSLNLFKPITNLKRPWEACEDEEDTVTMGAPIECYMGTKHPQLVRYKFYQDLAKGDLLVGEIISWRRNIYELKFICMDGGQARMPMGDIFIQCQVVQKNEIFEEGDFIRCCLIDIKDEIIRATTDIEELKTIDPLLSLKVTLGGVERKELPKHQEHLKIVDDDRSLVDDLTTDTNEPFTNPTCTSYLLERLGITGRDRLSLFSESTLPLPQDHEMKDYLRKAQSRDSAQKLVSRGIEQFKKGECSNAMNFYRQALELDNENVDALVARGALYNSRKQYPLACKDLEEAYKLDPKHKNAKNYLIQILFDQANYMMKMSKSKEELDRAGQWLEKIITLDPEHIEAKKKLDILRKPSVWRNPNETQPQTPKTIDEQIRDRLEPQQNERDLDYEITKKLEELRRKKEKKEKDKKRKKEKKERKDRRRSRSRSRSPKRRNSSSNSSKVITIDDTPSRSRHSSSSSLSEKMMRQEKPLYQAPIRKVVKGQDFKKMEAISAKTSDIKGNLQDILGMLGKK